MNNIFDFKRFGDYFLYDLRRAKNNYGLSLLLLGCMPVIIFVLFQLIRLIFIRESVPESDELKVMITFISITVAILGAGAKLYGFVTEKRAGSDYLMLPASTFEKWLSMVLMVCVVLPVILFGLMFLSDTLLHWIFPVAYGTRIVDMDFLQGISTGLLNLEETGFYFNFPAVMYLNWCESLLVFTLGAVCFKKAKVAKTLLCIFAFSMVVSTLMVILTGNVNINSDFFDRFAEEPVKFVNLFNWVLSIIYTVVIGGLLAGLYFRLRTLKH